MHRRGVVITGVGVINAAMSGASAALGAWLAVPRPAARVSVGGRPTAR